MHHDENIKQQNQEGSGLTDESGWEFGTVWFVTGGQGRKVLRPTEESDWYSVPERFLQSVKIHCVKGFSVDSRDFFLEKKIYLIYTVTPYFRGNGGGTMLATPHKLGANGAEGGMLV
ncbi:MAG: hypothetical protein JXD19_00365 [Deltaproteobacteria bacterium]|nr:hypothetical protein [Deltaproteobacteria bacterium]